MSKEQKRKLPLLNHEYYQTITPVKRRPIKIAQFGEGNFLRGFVDWMIDKMNWEANYNCGIVVVQPLEKGRVDLLNKQNGLYTLYLSGDKNGNLVREHFLIDSIRYGINPYKDFNSFLRLAEEPDLRFVVSNTTESGIVINVDDEFEDVPKGSFPAKLVRFLYQRYQAFDGDISKGLIFLPCELMVRNGDRLKTIIAQYMEIWDMEEDFKDWVEQANSFCNTLVDRIVPGFPRHNKEKIYNSLGYIDELIVEGEQYYTWIIDGPEFLKEELPLDKAGLNVVFADNVDTYSQRKIRVFHGIHLCLGFIGDLLGLSTIREVIEEENIENFISSVIYEEMFPTLKLPESELNQFVQVSIGRFKNPYIHQACRDVIINALRKFDLRIMPSILSYHATFGDWPKKLTLLMSFVFIYYINKKQSGATSHSESGKRALGHFDNVDFEDIASMEGAIRRIMEDVELWHETIDNQKEFYHTVAVYLDSIRKIGVGNYFTTGDF